MAVGDVTARIVRSDGQEFIIGDGDWRILNDGLENWANLPYNVYSAEIPASDGAIITSKRVASVDRTIIAECKGSNPDELRADAIRFFNPKYSFEVHMTYRGRTRWCSGEQIGFNASEGNIYRRPQLTWTILCPNPYMQSEDDFGNDIAESVGRFGFPWVSFLPPELGSVEGVNNYAVVSVHVFEQSIAIENDGDVPSGMRVKIVAMGDVVNPSITVGSGFIRIIKKLKYGDEITLDTMNRPPSVIMNGKNIINSVDRNSSILDLQLGIGESVIEYDADDGYQNLSVSVFYYKQYLGV